MADYMRKQINNNIKNINVQSVEEKKYGEQWTTTSKFIYKQSGNKHCTPTLK